MIRFVIFFFLLLLLLTLQVSFVQTLPYPFDRIPLVLVVAIYLYQYRNQTGILWGLIFYGFILDILAISQAPLEIISYTLSVFTMIFLVTHIFTNRSFYSMAVTAILSLLVILLSELSLIGASPVFTSVNFSWQDVLFSQLWAMGFASFLLLFFFPSLRRMRFFLQKLILERL